VALALARAVRHRVIADRLPLELARVALVVAHVEQESERHLEHRLHFARVRREPERRLHHPDDRRDAEPGAREVLGQAGKHFHPLARQADLLLRLAQRGLLGRAVGGLGAPAWKAHLARMRLEVGRALGEEHGEARRVRDDRYQHRRHRAGGFPPDAIVAVYCGRWKGALEALPQRSDIEIDQPTSIKGDTAMKRFTLAAVLALAASGALAFHCPADMAKIDAALAKNPKLSAQQAAEVKKLRADGEAFHKAGKHQQSVDTLAKAMKILDIK